MQGVTLSINPPITAAQLFAFYQRNNICEVGFGPEVAARVLEHTPVYVAAFRADQLVGLARAVFDGLSAQIMELSLDLELQGAPGIHANGSLLEHDRAGIGHELATRLLDELRRRGATWISASVVAGCEEPFYQSLGFTQNTGMVEYMIDERPYTAKNRSTG